MSDTALAVDARAVPPARLGRLQFGWNWLGLVPFLAFATMFLILPTTYLVQGSLTDEDGQFTLQNYANLAGPVPMNAYVTSIEVSLVTAILGGLFGLLLAYAVVGGALPRRLRAGVMTFSGVASNFAGIPLALAFIYTLGRLGFLTVILKNLGIDIYAGGFSLYSKLGIELVYLYFQLPLMVLIIAPAIDGLKQEWREAAENMGASSFQYWRHIALPILAPTILGTMILLFGNAFGAQATAFQLTGGFIDLVTILIGRQISGDVLQDKGLGYAIAMGMVVIMGITLIAYLWLQRLAERWQR